MSVIEKGAKDESAVVADTKPEAVEARPSSELEDDETPKQDLQQTKTNESQKYPSTKALLVIIPALLLSVFLIALDRTIIATAIPKITDDFNSLGDVGWYISAYLLTFSSFQLLFGRIYTFYNPKWVMLAAIFIFEVGSAVCGAAPNSTALIVGRAIAGLGGAGIFSGAVVILLYAVPLHKRPMFQGMFGAVFGVASVIGPLMGGAFTTNVTWRWCFYINLPIGGVVMAIIAFVLKLDIEKKEKPTLYEQFMRLDPIGASLLIPGVVCVLLALQWGGTTYPWGNWRVILCLVLFGILIIAFIFVQIWKQDMATLPPRIFKNRTIIAGVLYATCLGGDMMIFVYYLPIWFQAIKGSSAVHSGIQSLPSILSLVIGSILSGAVVQKVGYYVPPMFACTIISTIGAGMITTFKPDTGHSMWIGYQVIWGLGFGFGFQQPNLAAQAVLAKKDAPMGISFVFFGNMMGGAIFAAVGQNIFTNKLAEGVATLGSITPEQIVRTGATDLRNVVSSADLPAILRIYNSALVHTFYVGLGLSAATVVGLSLFEWRSLKKEKKEQATDESGAAATAAA